MAATPQQATFIFIGQSRRIYSKDAYLSDVAGGAVRWDEGQGAGSGTKTHWTAPENVVLVEYAQITGTADTTKLQLTRDGVPTGDILRYVIHLTTLNHRPRLSIPFQRGSEISAIQLA